MDDLMPEAVKLAEDLIRRGQNLNLFGPRPPSVWDVEEFAHDIQELLIERDRVAEERATRLCEENIRQTAAAYEPFRRYCAEFCGHTVDCHVTRMGDEDACLESCGFAEIERLLTRVAEPGREEEGA